MVLMATEAVSAQWMTVSALNAAGLGLAGSDTASISVDPFCDIEASHPSFQTAFVDSARTVFSLASTKMGQGWKGLEWNPSFARLFSPIKSSRRRQSVVTPHKTSSHSLPVGNTAKPLHRAESVQTNLVFSKNVIPSRPASGREARAKAGIQRTIQRPLKNAFVVSLRQPKASPPLAETIIQRSNPDGLSLSSRDCFVACAPSATLPADKRNDKINIPSREGKKGARIYNAVYQSPLPPIFQSGEWREMRYFMFVILRQSRRIPIFDGILPLRQAQGQNDKMVFTHFPPLHYVEKRGPFYFDGWEEATATFLPSDIHSDVLSTPGQVFAATLHGREVFGFGQGVFGPASDLQHNGREEISTENHLVLLLLSQLMEHPSNLGEDQLRSAFNAALLSAGYPETVSRESFALLLDQAMSLAVRQVSILGPEGFMSRQNVEKSAAQILNIDTQRFCDWQTYFGKDYIGLQFAGQEVKPLLTPLMQHLTGMLKDTLVLRSLVAFDLGEAHFAITREEEIRLQWKAARLSVLSNADQKIIGASLSIQSLAERGRIHEACRLLAMFVAHSGTGGSVADAELLVPKWSLSEIDNLVGALVQSPSAAVVSHRSFRRYLGRRENRRMNLAIYQANYAGAVTKLRGEQDLVSVGDDDFWARVDATGQSEVIEDTFLTAILGHWQW